MTETGCDATIENRIYFLSLEQRNLEPELVVVFTCLLFIKFA